MLYYHLTDGTALPGAGWVEVVVDPSYKERMGSLYRLEGEALKKEKEELYQLSKVGMRAVPCNPECRLPEWAEGFKTSHLYPERILLHRDEQIMLQLRRQHDVWLVYVKKGGKWELLPYSVEVVLGQFSKAGGVRISPSDAHFVDIKLGEGVVSFCSGFVNGKIPRRDDKNAVYAS